MPLNIFTDKAFEGLAQGKEQIIVGSLGPDFDEMISKRNAAFATLSQALKNRG